MTHYEFEMQWQEVGSGPGYQQRVRVNRDGRAQTAYQTFLAHASGCTACNGPGGRCETGEHLWQTYKAALPRPH